MGVWSRIADFARRRAGDAGDDKLWGDWAGGGQSNSGVPVNSFTAMQHVACMACVSILATDVAKIPFDISDRLPDGGKKIAKAHPLHRLLRRPNDWQTAFEFKEMLQASLVLRGNAYAVANRNGRGDPLSMVPIHPDRVGLFEAPSGQYFYCVTRNGLHEMAMLREHPLLIPSDDMLHIRWMPMWNSLLGSSRLAFVRKWLGLGIGLEMHQARLSGRARGPVACCPPIRSSPARKSASSFAKSGSGYRQARATRARRRSWSRASNGCRSACRWSIANSSSPANFQLRDIARAFDVPPYKLAIEGETEGPAMVQMGQQYLNGPISGYCERWTAKAEQFYDVTATTLFLPGTTITS